jgi:hypothetical protein
MEAHARQLIQNKLLALIARQAVSFTMDMHLAAGARKGGRAVRMTPVVRTPKQLVAQDRRAVADTQRGSEAV